MKLTISTHNNKKSSHHKLQKRFDKLQKKLLKEKKLMDKMMLQVDLIVNQFNDLNTNLNTQYLEKNEVLALKLIKFCSRKSMARWQREEVQQWFMDINGKIQNVAPELSTQLSDQMEQAHADYVGISVEELRAKFEEMQRYENELDEELFCEPDFDEESEHLEKNKPSDSPFQDDFFSDDFEQFEEKEGSFTEDPFVNTEQPSLMSEQWIRKIFRRTAKELHPDKEQDPIKQKQKQQQMSELLNARKNNDIMTMLMIYNEHVNDSELSFAEDEMNTICLLVEQQIEQLNQEKYHFLYASPYREMMHDLVYNPSSKKQQLNFKTLTDDLELSYQSDVNTIPQLKNLKQLKEVLIEREEQRRMNFKMEIDDIFDFGDIFNDENF